MFEWVGQTLRSYREIALFLSLGIGYYVGKFPFKGIGLGAVTATLLAAVVIGQLGIAISPNVKSTFFLIFLFAVGYGVGPQFVRGVAKDGLPQAIFSVVQCVLCLGIPVMVAKAAGYDLGYAAGLYAGSQTISASMGLATDAINRTGLAVEQVKGLLDARVFVLRIRRDGKIEEATTDTVLRKGDVLAVAGAREVLVRIGEGAKEVEDPELLSVPVEGVDVYVTNKAVDGKTLVDLAQRPIARGVFLRKITRGAVATTIPVLPNTKIYRGDIVTLVGRTQDTSAAARDLAVP